MFSRESAARAALEVIDERGLSGLTLQAVADRLGVMAPSLYNHLKDRNSLLLEVAQLLWEKAHVQSVPEATVALNTEELKEALVALCVSVRSSLLEHPNAAPLLLEVLPRHIFTDRYERWIASLNVSNIPVDHQIVLVDGLEMLTYGSALLGASAVALGSGTFPDVDEHEYPNLGRASRVAADADTRFEETLRDFLDGALAHQPAPKKTSKASGSLPANGSARKPAKTLNGATKANGAAKKTSAKKVASR